MRGRILLSVFLAIAVYTAIVLYSDAGQVAGAVSRVALWWVPLFLSLSLTNYGLRFLKWQYLLRRVDVRVPAGESLGVFLAGFSMTVSPGKLGELVKCYLLKERRDVPVSRTSPVVVAERLTDLLSMLVIAALGLLLVSNADVLPALAAGLALVAMAMAVLLWAPAFSAVLSLLCRIGALARRREGLVSFQRHCSSVLDPASLAVSVPLGVLSWGAEALVLCLVARSMGLELPVGLALLAHSAGSIAGAVSMIPGGLGLTEITIGALLTEVMSEPDAAAVTIVMRFATLWFAVLLGLVMLGVERRGARGSAG